MKVKELKNILENINDEYDVILEVHYDIAGECSYFRRQLTIECVAEDPGAEAFIITL